MANAFGDIKYKKTVIFCIIIWLIRFFCVASFVCPRVLGTDIQKAFYRIENILNSQDIHRRYYASFLPSNGGYSTRYWLIDENEKIRFVYGIATDNSFGDVIQKAELLKNEINGFISNNSVFDNNTIEVYLSVECVGHGEIILKNYYDTFDGVKVYTKELQHISVGQSAWIAGYGAVTSMNVLPFISSFESVDLYGYWGDELTIPKNLKKSDFDDFTDLKQLEIYCQEQDEEFARQVLSELEDFDVGVNREHCIDGVWTSYETSTLNTYG